jgi:hypothetical protein
MCVREGVLVRERKGVCVCSKRKEGDVVRYYILILLLDRWIAS